MYKNIYRGLAEAVVKMDSDEVTRLAQSVIERGIPAEEAIEQGLAAGMNEVGKLFAAKEYFVPEVLVCAQTMYKGFNILKDSVVEGSIRSKGTIVIGVVAGDFHDIGKNIVKLLLEASGFKIIDAGKNASADTLLQSLAADAEVSIVALSTLMTTTMESMKEIVAKVKNTYPEKRIMVGGAPLNSDFARSIGADFYGKDAREAVAGAHRLMGLEFAA